MIDFKKFLDVCKIYDQYISLTTVEQLFEITNQSENQFKNRNEKALHRYEFLEIIVRLAQAKYKDPKITPSLKDSLEKIIKEDILANFKIKKCFRTSSIYKH